jgi:hypothetical protein
MGKVLLHWKCWTENREENESQRHNTHNLNAPKWLELLEVKNAEAQAFQDNTFSSKRVKASEWGCVKGFESDGINIQPLVFKGWDNSRKTLPHERKKPLKTNGFPKERTFFWWNGFVHDEEFKRSTRNITGEWLDGMMELCRRDGYRRKIKKILCWKIVGSNETKRGRRWKRKGEIMDITLTGLHQINLN